MKQKLAGVFEIYRCLQQRFFCPRQTSRRVTKPWRMNVFLLCCLLTTIREHIFYTGARLYLPVPATFVIFLCRHLYWTVFRRYTCVMMDYIHDLYSANIFILFITTVSNKLCSFLRTHYHYFTVTLHSNFVSWQHFSGCFSSVYIDKPYLNDWKKKKTA